MAAQARASGVGRDPVEVARRQRRSPLRQRPVDPGIRFVALSLVHCSCDLSPEIVRQDLRAVDGGCSNGASAAARPFGDMTIGAGRVTQACP
jgi:hypothetical protein